MTAELYLWADAAVALCEYACGWDKGRGKDDPVYLEVVEHRDVPPMRAKYSSCGDLAWWLLYRLGLRKPWMNRAANHTYNIGMNVADLSGCPAHIVPGADFVPEPGDILEIWNRPGGEDAHVCVVVAVPFFEKITLANYGAGGMSPSAWPGANIHDADWRHSVAGHYVGTRRLQRVVRLASIVPLLTEQVDLTGARVTGELIDALGAKWSEK
ncbi:MAG TPA: hypothetical protein VI195_06865 [Steroidobacteraceae bacterium]